MKKILFAVIIAASTLVMSCNKNSGDLEFRLYTYANVYQAVDQEFDIYFETDNEFSFFINNNLSGVDLAELEVGDRVVVEVSIEGSSITGFDNAATLHKLYNVVMGDYTTVSNSTENEAIGDDELSFVLNDFLLYKGYLNLYVGFATADLEGAKFYLVENAYQTPETTEAGYINLELRYDEGSESDQEVVSYSKYLCFNTTQLSGLLETNEGIILRLNTKNSGVSYVKIEAL